MAGPGRAGGQLGTIADEVYIFALGTIADICSEYDHETHCCRGRRGRAGAHLGEPGEDAGLVEDVAARQALALRHLPRDTTCQAT